MMMSSYNSDLKDEEWEFLQPILVKKKRRGPKSRVDIRKVVDGIFYLLRTGCQWRYIPKEYGPSAAIIDSQSVKTVQKGGLEAMMLVKRLRGESGI
jgi:transposase